MAPTRSALCLFVSTVAISFLALLGGATPGGLGSSPAIAGRASFVRSLPTVGRCGVAREVSTYAREGGVTRRGVGAGVLAALGMAGASRSAWAADVAPICDSACDTSLGDVPLQTTRTGLQYRDIKVGSGDPPPKAFDVVVHYTLKIQTQDGMKEFFNSREGVGRPLDVRIGTGMVIPGLDEGLSTMRSGGVRRLYIPGNLSFPKGVKAKPGSPSVPPNSAIVADVQLIYIPGIDDDLVVNGGEDAADEE
eukprot:CAMPEP_0197525610 /NCGR_PEP_ID=MMETSP1318-20131121/13362_1 /TAXON_ID=552666 /ORGANISM="Partenskyella glossopodia, Strain RCC365" /LENGTH=249 /DNA_ID=CAMNT_0043079211 /DNA_START=11 /DNA_END=760 /DNA_ORIENTATION=+